MYGDNILHLADGKFATTKGKQQLNNWLDTIFQQPPESGLVLHFHGGLVSEQNGRAIAEKLTPTYEQAKAAPLFFVWESGLLETLKNNGHEIQNEKFFKATVKKVSKWALKQLPTGLGLKGNGPSMLKEAEVADIIEDWLEHNLNKPADITFIGVSNVNNTVNKGALNQQTVSQKLLVDLEYDINSDKEFKDAYTAVYNGLYTQDTRIKSKSRGTAVSATSAISEKAANELFNIRPANSKGGLSWAKAAKMIAGIVVRVVKRFINDRDHGFYLTLVEEVLRALYADKLGGYIWETMKKDTADAFLENEQAGGFALLQELKTRLPAQQSQPVITLIGHSTGAVYIRHFLDSAANIIPNVQFNIIFLAAAESYEGFSSVLEKHAQRINAFRNFAMEDEWEKRDGIVPVLYPASLLYFVSGLLEDEVDKPLVGMQRYLNEKVFNHPRKFSDITIAKAFFTASNKRLVFAPADTVDGARSMSNTHGGFDDDNKTLKSIQHILLNGYL